MTSHRLSPPYVECVTVLLTLLSTALTPVVLQEPAQLCHDDRKPIACPLPCYCGAPDYRSVRCDAGGLRSVPASVWSVVPLSLNFSFNNVAEWTYIDVASADDEHVACLGTLILDHSGIVRLRPRAFERLRGLRQLRLHHNRISTLQTAAFVGLRRLELLDLSHNELVALPRSLFDELSQLKMLRLAANRLRSLPATSLRLLTQLRTLDLSDNPLIALPRDLLVANTRLFSLNVSATRLSRLVLGTTRPVADALGVLDMSRCRQLTAAPDARDVAVLTRLRRLALPEHVCRCDVINFRSVLDNVRSRQRRSRLTLICGATVAAAAGADATCSDASSSPPRVSVSVKPVAVQRDVRSDEPLPYDPMLGWYTAAVLSGLLFTFIACVGLEKAEKQLVDACMARHGSGKHLEHIGGGGGGQQQQHWWSSSRQQQQQQHEHVRTSASVCTVTDYGAGVDS